MSDNVTVYVDDGAGNASQDMLDAVEEILIGEGTEEKPGRKAGGINLRVLAPSKVTINVTVEVTDDGTLAQETIEYNVKNAISDYINNLQIGEDVILNRIRSAIMEVAGVEDITITAPTGNETINDNQIGRTGVITVTFA